MSAPAIRFTGITKRYPGITALAGVSFDVAQGSVHAVCGENGAGKSTLGKVLAGVSRADSGTIELNGNSVSFASPRDALAAGVAMVHQELAHCGNMSVAENLCLGALPHRFGFVDRVELRRRAGELLREVGATIDPDRSVDTLSVAEQQIVQIAAAVGADARVIVFDEPSSSLGETEAEALYLLIGALRTRGVTILYVSHRMPEIYRLSDTITVLRDGAHVVTSPTASLAENSLVQQMIGRPLEEYFSSHAAKPRGAELLRVERLSSTGKFTEVSFAVHAREVVGLAGLVGAGRSEIAQAIFGLDASVTGRVFVDGAEANIRSPRDAMKLGIGFVPENRKQQGLVLAMRAHENSSLAVLEQYASRSWIDGDRELRAVREQFTDLQLRANPSVVAESLSGGNQQKIVLSKWLLANGRVLILDEPTRGIDVGTKAELHALIDRRAAEGVAVLLISSELPELLNVASRIVVLRAGRIVGEVTRAEATQDLLIRMMTGLQ